VRFSIIFCVHSTTFQVWDIPPHHLPSSSEFCVYWPTVKMGPCMDSAIQCAVVYTFIALIAHWCATRATEQNRIHSGSVHTLLMKFSNFISLMSDHNLLICEPSRLQWALFHRSLPLSHPNQISKAESFTIIERLKDVQVDDELSQLKYVCFDAWPQV